MTADSSPPLCVICRRPETEADAAKGLCPSCEALSRIVQEQPDVVKQLWRRHQGEPILPEAIMRPIENEAELPEVLDGKRYRTVDRDRNKWYLSVSEVDGKPVEIFASTAFDRDHELQARIANLTTITRLISLLLRHISLGESITFSKCLRQIQRSSRQKNDLPDMLYGVLNRYRTDDTEQAD